MSQEQKKRSWWKKPTQLAAAVWERILWFLEKPTVAWIVCGALAVLVFFGLRYLHQQSTANGIDANSIRNYIFGLGGVGALLGVWLASIRGMDLAKQVDNQTEEVKLRKQQTRSETLSRCVEQIGNKDSATLRTTGIRGLEFLAQDHQDDVRFLEHICDILQGFINKCAPPLRPLNTLQKLVHTTEWRSLQGVQDLIREANLDAKEATKLEEWSAHWKKYKEEAGHAVYVIGRINTIKPEILSGPDLSFRYLPQLQLPKKGDDRLNWRGGSLFSSFLPDASLSNIDLRGVGLIGTSLHGASLRNTDLREENFFSANFKGAHLQGANLQKTRFFNPKIESKREFRLKTRLEESDFENAKLAGAVYYESENDFKKDVANNSYTLGIPVTPEWLKAQGAENWSKAIYSDDPKPKDSKK